MDESRIRTMEQVRRFLEGTADVEFPIDTKQKRYEWIEEPLIRFRYLERCKTEKGLLLKFLEKVSGYSHVQVKRFVRQYFETGHVRRRKAKKRGFIRKCTDADISLLAETDELHSTLSGPATKKVCERYYTLFGAAAYTRPAAISVANLRRSVPYRRVRIHFTKTRPTPVAIRGGHHQTAVASDNTDYVIPRCLSRPEARTDWRQTKVCRTSIRGRCVLRH